MITTIVFTIFNITGKRQDLAAIRRRFCVSLTQSIFIIISQMCSHIVGGSYLLSRYLPPVAAAAAAAAAAAPYQEPNFAQ
jgi:hypothetical protein